ncbi:hypothetical protein ACSQ67_003777 [Phaseolus vulgaris]
MHTPFSEWTTRFVPFMKCLALPRAHSTSSSTSLSTLLRFRTILKRITFCVDWMRVGGLRFEDARKVVERFESHKGLVKGFCERGLIGEVGWVLRDMVRKWLYGPDRYLN